MAQQCPKGTRREAAASEGFTRRVNASAAAFNIKIHTPSPPGLLSSPANTADVKPITQSSVSCLGTEHSLYISKVIDFELRRELLRAGPFQGQFPLSADHDDGYAVRR